MANWCVRVRVRVCGNTHEVEALADGVRQAAATAPARQLVALHAPLPARVLAPLLLRLPKPLHLTAPFAPPQQFMDYYKNINRFIDLFVDNKK